MIKKALLLLFIPLTGYSQVETTEGDQIGIISLIIGLAILLIVFMFLRNVFLWYWKVNDIVKNQEQTNRLLTSILRELEIKNNPIDNKNPDNI